MLYIINEFSKLIGQKFNPKKSVASLHMNTKLSEKQINKRILFAITSKRIKYLERNLSKEEKEVYAGNYKSLMKKLQEI